jgi:hypothetical protein
MKLKKELFAAVLLLGALGSVAMPNKANATHPPEQTTPTPASNTQNTVAPIQVNDQQMKSIQSLLNNIGVSSDVRQQLLNQLRVDPSQSQAVQANPQANNGGISSSISNTYRNFTQAPLPGGSPIGLYVLGANTYYVVSPTGRVKQWSCTGRSHSSEGHGGFGFLWFQIAGGGANAFSDGDETGNCSAFTQDQRVQVATDDNAEHALLAGNDDLARAIYQGSALSLTGLPADVQQRIRADYQERVDRNNSLRQGTNLSWWQQLAVDAANRVAFNPDYHGRTYLSLESGLKDALEHPENLPVDVRSGKALELYRRFLREEMAKIEKLPGFFDWYLSTHAPAEDRD